MAFASKFKRAADFVKKAYNKNLLVSNTLTTMSLLAAGDLMTQFIEIKLNDTSSTFPNFNVSPVSMLTSGMQTSKMLTQSHSIITVSETNSNIVCKKEESKSFFLEKCDWNRTAKFTAIGLLMGPFGHYWYTILDKVYHKRTALNIARKMVCDQLIAAPIFNCITILGTLFLDGKNVEQAMCSLREKFLDVYLYDCLIWPVAQFINFNFVPGVYRLLYVNAVSLFWNSILSFLMYDQTEEIEEEN